MIRRRRYDTLSRLPDPPGMGLSRGTLVRANVAALGLEVLFGGLTVTGSLIAFGKLQEILPGRLLIFK
jgi:NAD(P) transhydrogenase subunit beta